MKKSLKISIIVFVIVALCALYLVLNKGHIGNIALVSTSGEKTEDIVKPNLTLELEKKYLSSKDEEDTCKTTVSIDAEIVRVSETEKGYEYGVKFLRTDEEAVSDIKKLIEDKEAIIGNTRYSGNDYETEIGYILNGEENVMYILYVEDLLVIQIGYSDEGPKFIAYK